MSITVGCMTRSPNVTGSFTGMSSARSVMSSDSRFCPVGRDANLNCSPEGVVCIAQTDFRDKLCFRHSPGFKDLMARLAKQNSGVLDNQDVGLWVAGCDWLWPYESRSHSMGVLGIRYIYKMQGVAIMLVYGNAYGIMTWHSWLYMCPFMQLLLIALEYDYHEAPHHAM